MKNITLSADERLIEEARDRARRDHTTLNAEFRKWLLEYSGRRERVERAMRTLKELQKTIKLKGPFLREEMEARGPLPGSAK
jgi:hypothetical protein